MSHYATGTVSILNVDSEDELAAVEELIESALRGAGYKGTAHLTAHPNKPAPGGDQ
jgi:hypothetical protein